MANISITNLDQFNTAMRRIMNDNADKQREILVKVSEDGHKVLQETTPHKTGRARAGWNNTVDSSPSEWMPDAGKDYYPKTPFKDKNKIDAYSTINLSNNVEYIVALEEGHSDLNEHMVDKMFAGLTANLNQQTRKESSRRVK